MRTRKSDSFFFKVSGSCSSQGQQSVGKLWIPTVHIVVIKPSIPDRRPTLICIWMNLKSNQILWEARNRSVLLGLLPFFSQPLFLK